MTPVITDASTTPVCEMIRAGSHSEWKQASEAVPLVFGPWHLNVVKEVFRVSRIAPDWDSYGSAAPTAMAASQALAIVRYVAANGLDESVPIPDVFPVPGGGIRLEWQSIDRELALDALPDGSVEFFRAQNDQVIDEGELVRHRIPALLEWISAV